MKLPGRIVSEISGGLGVGGSIGASLAGSDGFWTPVPIAGDGTFYFDNSTASQDGLDHAECKEFGAFGPDKDVWFCWTAANSGSVTIRTCGLTSVDTKVAVYDACSMASDALLACSDDPCGSQSAVSFSAVSGNEYGLRIGTFPGSAGGTGSFEIISATGPVPDNDLCSNAIGPLAIPSTVGGTTVGATIDAGTPVCFDELGSTQPAAPGVWYTLVGTGTTITASMCAGATYNDRISVFCGDCDDLTCIVAGDDTCGAGLGPAEVSWCSEGGATYFILVHGTGPTDVGPFALTLSENGVACSGGTSCVTGGACCLDDNFTCIISTSGFCEALVGGYPSYMGDGTICEGAFPFGFTSCGNVLEDISGTGINLNLGDDTNAVVPLGFTFNYYAFNYTQVQVDSNGYLTFDLGAASDFTNEPLAASPTVDNLIAPAWDDWSPSISGAVLIQTLGTPHNRRFIAQWDNVPQFGEADSSTFQVILFENGSGIEFRYGTMAPGNADGTIPERTSGVESPDGTFGVDTGDPINGSCVSIDNLQVPNICGGDECWLVMGGDDGPSAFDAGSHIFAETQISDHMASWPVTMVDGPSIQVDRAAAIGRLRSRINQAWGNDWVPIQPALYLQILMWNPQLFPANPEQSSRGMAVYALPDGRVFSRNYGTQDGGIYFTGVETYWDQGIEWMHFPFMIEGF